MKNYIIRIVIFLTMVCFFPVASNGEDGLKIDGRLRNGAIVCESKEMLDKFVSTGKDKYCLKLDLTLVTSSGKKSSKYVLVPVTIRQRADNSKVKIAYYDVFDKRDRGDGVIVWRYRTNWGWTLENNIVPYSP